MGMVGQRDQNRTCGNGSSRRDGEMGERMGMDLLKGGMGYFRMILMHYGKQN